MYAFKFALLLLLPLCCLLSCNRIKAQAGAGADKDMVEQKEVVAQKDPRLAELERVLREAEIPNDMARRISQSAAADIASGNGVSDDTSFFSTLTVILQQDPYLRKLVDKSSYGTLSANYVPADLVELGSSAYQLNRAGLMLRKAAADSLEEMAVLAKDAGVTLIASSAFRTYQYQEEVYNRNVRNMGKEEADRESARPGHSQHQLGLVVDFGSIDDSFAETRAGKWMANNASLFGWSISYPAGYEDLTGYRWESWHYRYVGRELAGFIDFYFDGIQQHALRFIHEWEKSHNERSE